MTLAALAAALGCGRSSTPPDTTKTTPAARKDEVRLTGEEQRAAGIEVAAAVAGQQTEALRVPGRIALADDRTWRVGIRTDGVVVASFAGVGDYVKKGQVLARYHADEVRDSRALYRASQAELATSTAAAALAQRNVDRAAKLLELKAGSQVQLEQARQDLEAAQAAVRRDQVEVDRLKDLLEDDLRVPADPGPGDETADQVPILAPASGYILEKNVTLGRAIHTDDDTFVIGDLSQVWMLASVRQEDLGRLHTGQPVTLTVNGAGEVAFRGRITNLGQQLDPETRTMQVRIAVNNPGTRLRPEMLATAAIPVGGTQPTVMVPADALQQIDGQDVVFVRVAPDRFAVRPVRPGPTNNSRTPILDGLKAGEPVVVTGSFVVKSQLLRASLEDGE
jgi:multidrug efflux pump subunit AcrA (membrane-fusion protein)